MLKKLYKKYKANRLYYLYSKYLEDKTIDDKMILLDPKQSQDINGNMFYLIKELDKTNYKVYVSVSKNRYDEFNAKFKYYNISNCHLLISNTKKYYKVISHAKYLFSDTSFKQFFRKKEGQIYFNTWHGTPFKNMGRSTNRGYEAIGNVQRNFMMSDYILFPSKYMKDLMLEDYMLNNIGYNIKCFMSGYPRNEIFFDDKRRSDLRQELGLTNKEIIMFMPTYRDTDDSNILKDYLDEISELLNDNQIMYVNFYPLVKDKIKLDSYKNIKQLDPKYETYDFLNVADILVTDYSSVFFDFAITKRKIILFTPDESEYFKNRGTYFSFDLLPFKKVKTVAKLIEEINNKDNLDTSSFLEKYCSFENKNSSKKILDYVLNNKKSNIKIEEISKNNKKNMLVYVGNLKDNKVDLFIKKYSKDYNIYLTYYTSCLKEDKVRLKKLKKDVFYYPTYKKNYGSLKENLYLFLKNKKIIKNSKVINQYYYNEFKRRYGDIKLDAVALIKNDKNMSKILGSTDCKKVV